MLGQTRINRKKEFHSFIAKTFDSATEMMSPQAYHRKPITADID